MAKKVSRNPGGALDLATKTATAAVFKKSKQTLSTSPQLIIFYNTGKGLYLGKSV